MIYINSTLVHTTIKQAKELPRRRKNFNFHDTLDANVQRMLNALEPGTYVQPHKHENPDKVEAFLILTGKILVVEFNDEGEIVDFTVLSSESGNYGVEIPPRVWHSILALESGTVVYEVKDGPYSVIDDKNFATWAPKEGDEACAIYNQNILKQCGLS
jgi:cupin fold WbuC family metalloprotein